MPELARRRSTDAREECGHVYYGDVLAVRSRSAAATRMTKTRGNGIAVSIRAHTQANIRTEPPPAAKEPAPISKPRGRFFWRSEPSQKPSTLMKCVCRHAMAPKINIDSR